MVTDLSGKVVDINPAWSATLGCGSYRLLSWLAVRDRELIYAGARDITDLKQTQEKLQTLRNRLAQSSRHTVVGALTASIAHEIKQPLAGM